MAFLSLGQPLALRAFPFQRKGIDEDRFLLSNFKWNKPPSVSSFRAQSRNPSCPPVLFGFFRENIPISRCHTYDAIPVCKIDPSTSFGMTLREYLFSHI